MADATTPSIWPILGTMTFGAQVKFDAATVLVRSFVATGRTKTPCGSMIDTASIFEQAIPNNAAEGILGEMFAMYPSLEAKSSVATKASKFMPPHFSLSRQSVIDQCDASLEKMELDCIDLFYLECPDIETDITDTLAGIDKLHKDGKITEFGLSNYPAWAVVDIWHRCKAQNMLLPTVYQGMYNVITRDLEREILPVVRQYGLRLYVYNPLAGGMLTGRYATPEDMATVATGRFSAQFDATFGDKDKTGTELYRKRYGKAPIFDGLEVIRRACAPEESGSVDASAAEPTVQESTVDGIKVRLEVTETKSCEPGLDMSNVALRWLLHHSLLADGDGIILGASKGSHLAANLGAWQSGPLPSKLLEACNAAWEIARPACEPYFRGYGASPGGIEKFLQLKATGAPDKKPKTQDEAAPELTTNP